MNKEKNYRGFSLAWVIGIVVVTSIISGITTGVIVYNNNRLSYNMTYGDLSDDKELNEFLTVYANILSDYYEDVDTGELLDKAIAGMMDYLGDDYSTYLDDETTAELFESLSGEYKGIGVSINNTDKSIVEVYKLDENNDYKTYSNWILDGFNFTIIEDGSYKIVIKNDFNLSNNYFFSIKTSLPVASLTDLAGNQLSSGDEILGTVKVSYNEDEVEEFKVYLNGEIYYGETEEFSEVGKYTIYLTDKAGNQSSYSFNIIASDDLNWAGIVTLIAMFTALIGVGIFLFLKFKRPFKLK